MNNAALKSILALTAILLATGHVQAHELFLKPDNYFLQPHSNESLRLVNGTFDKSLNFVSRERMLDVSIVAEGKVRHPSAADWHDVDASSYLAFSTGNAGTYVAGVSTRPSLRTLAAEDFRGFLKLYGALDSLASFDSDSKLSAVRQRSSKHVKAVIQIGNAHSPDYSRRLGYPVEIILRNNPYELKLGDELSFQVLHHGTPVANQLVYASHAGFHEDDASEKRLNAQKLRTDHNGVASFKVGKNSAWYIALIHAQPAKDAEADYDVNWSTLTFEMRPQLMAP